MKTDDDSFFANAVDPKQEARFLALEVVCRLLVWMAEGASLEERGVRATVALYCIRPDLINEAILIPRRSQGLICRWNRSPTSST